MTISPNNTFLVQIFICYCLDYVFAFSLSLFQIILCEELMTFYSNSNPSFSLLKIPLPVRQLTGFLAEREPFHLLLLPSTWLILQQQLITFSSSYQALALLWNLNQLFCEFNFSLQLTYFLF